MKEVEYTSNKKCKLIYKLPFTSQKGREFKELKFPGTTKKYRNEHSLTVNRSVN